MKNYNLTAADVSAATNLTVGTVYNAKHKGLLKSIKHKSNIFFAEEDVKEEHKEDTKDVLTEASSDIKKSEEVPTAAPTSTIAE